MKFPASCGLESKAAGSGRSQGTGRSFCAAPVKLGHGGVLWSRRRRRLCAAGRRGRGYLGFGVAALEDGKVQGAAAGWFKEKGRESRGRRAVGSAGVIPGEITGFS